MFLILAAYGVPPEAIAQIKALYDNSTGRIRLDGIVGDPFLIEQGILQGDTLAPFLFIIVMDYILRRTDQELQHHTADATAATTAAAQHNNIPIHTRITRSTIRNQQQQQAFVTDLDYADDVAIIDASLESAQVHLLILEREALAVGLRINCSKTKYVAILPETLQITHHLYTH
jgi:hypothetical protein